MVLEEAEVQAKKKEKKIQRYKMNYLLDKHLKKLEENLATDKQNYSMLLAKLKEIESAIVAKQGAIDILNTVKKESEKQKDE